MLFALYQPSCRRHPQRTARDGGVFLREPGVIPTSSSWSGPAHGADPGGRDGRPYLMDLRWFQRGVMRSLKLVHETVSILGSFRSQRGAIKTSFVDIREINGIRFQSQQGLGYGAYAGSAFRSKGTLGDISTGGRSRNGFPRKSIPRGGRSRSGARPGGSGLGIRGPGDTDPAGGAPENGPRRRP